MINVYDDQVELTFEDVSSQGYINITAEADGTCTFTAVNQHDHLDDDDYVCESFSRETMIDFLEEALAKLKHS